MIYKQRAKNSPRYWDDTGWCHNKEAWLKIDPNAEFADLDYDPQLHSYKGTPHKIEDYKQLLDGKWGLIEKHKAESVKHLHIKTSPIQQIKEDTGILEVISKYTTLKGRYPQYMGKCPFHNDKSPSLSVNTEIKKWHCFGCGKSGDLIDFVELAENTDTHGAMEIIRGGYG